jgi:hypothetical protein
MPSRQIKPKLNSLLLLGAPLCLFLLWSCGDGNSVTKNSASGSGAISFHIVYHDDADGAPPSNSAKIDCADLDIAKIEAKIYGPDDTPLAAGGPWSCDAGQGTILSVPAGSDRTVVVMGKDADEMVTLRGQKSGIDIIADNENNIGTVECYGFVPNLLSPEDGAVVVRDVATLKWEDVAGATQYWVKISQNNDMENPLIEEFTATLEYIVTGMDPETTYYWQVFARDSDENMGRGSQIRSIQITQISAKLPDTGQEHIESYTPVPGEDMTYTINPPSYTKLDADGHELDTAAAEWAMVRDNVTGLIWEVKTDDDTIHDKDDLYNLPDARAQFIAELNDSNFGGYSDWRLPTIKELANIAHRGNSDPAINTDFFANTMTSTAYWSDTAAVWKAADRGWAVDFGSGDVLRNDSGSKGAALLVRAVRGGQLTGNLVDNGDGTVTDTATGLMWQQLESGMMTWAAALDHCETLSLAGYGDWRLPNINELYSIVHHKLEPDEGVPLIDSTFFPNAGAAPYWSSTTFVNYTDKAWKVDFSYGHILIHIKSEGYNVRAVRQADLVLDD